MKQWAGKLIGLSPKRRHHVWNFLIQSWVYLQVFAGWSSTITDNSEKADRIANREDKDEARMWGRDDFIKVFLRRAFELFQYLRTEDSSLFQDRHFLKVGCRHLKTNSCCKKYSHQPHHNFSTRIGKSGVDMMELWKGYASQECTCQETSSGIKHDW